MNPHAYTVIIRRDPDGDYLASVIELPGCHTQADTLDELRANVREAIEVYLDETIERLPELEFVGVETITV